MRYFSERQGHEVPRSSDKISERVWRGIRALILARIGDGSFAVNYRENCFDGPVPIGTDDMALYDAMRARILGLSDSLWNDSLDWSDVDHEERTFNILDIIEFCWANISEPIQLTYHDFGKHFHLSFDVETGRDKFRSDIEEIFRRNGIAYSLTKDGRIERVLPSAFEGLVLQSEASTGDSELDRLLTVAQRKFIDPRPEVRPEALEALWDAWERLKTLGGEGDKRAQAQAMLDNAAGTSSPKFRDALDREAIELTRIGNSLRIRHSETNQEILATSEHMDYLYYRLYSLIQLVLKSQ